MLRYLGASHNRTTLTKFTAGTSKHLGFIRATGDQAINLHGFLLPNPMAPGLRLHIILWVPVGIKQDNLHRPEGQHTSGCVCEHDGFRIEHSGLGVAQEREASGSTPARQESSRMVSEQCEYCFCSRKQQNLTALTYRICALKVDALPSCARRQQENKRIFGATGGGIEPIYGGLALGAVDASINPLKPVLQGGHRPTIGAPTVERQW